MDESISAFDHFLDVSKVGDAAGSVVAYVDCVDDGLIPLEQFIAEEVEGLHAFEGHLHDHLSLDPEAPHLLGLFLTWTLPADQQHPPQYDAPDLSAQSAFLLLVLTVLHQPLGTFPLFLLSFLKQDHQCGLSFAEEGHELCEISV